MRSGSAAPWIVGVVMAAPVLIASYPPMSDLPLHEALVGILRHFGDERYFPKGLYVLNFGHPNQLFYLPAYLLSFVVSTSTACKLVVAATVALIPPAAARFGRYVGASPWAALAIAPISLGWLFYWGLIANLVGLAALLVTLPVLDELAARPSWKKVLAAIGVMLVLFESHEAMMVSACGALLFLTLLQPLSLRSPKALLQRLTPNVAAFALALAHVFYAATKTPPSVKAVLPHLAVAPLYKLATLPGILFAGLEPAHRNLLFLLNAGALALLFVQRKRGPRAATVRDALFGARFEIVAGGLFALYLAMPLTLNGATLVYQRFLAPAYAIFALSIAARAKQPSRVACVWLTLLPVAQLLSVWPTFIDAHIAFRDLDSLAAMMEPRSSVACIRVGAIPEHRLFYPGSGEGHIVAMHGGRALYTYTESPLSPIRVADRYHWEEPVMRVISDPLTFRPSHDLTRFRYLLIDTQDAALGWATKLALEPDARLIDVKGEWWLYESTHELVALDSPDIALPVPHPATLRKRTREVLERNGFDFSASNLRGAAPTVRPAAAGSDGGR